MGRIFAVFLNYVGTFLVDCKKKTAKIKTCKNLVSHGTLKIK